MDSRLGASLAERPDVVGVASVPPALRTKDLEEQLKNVRTGTIHALSLLLDLKDLKTGLHATRLAAWAVRVGEHLGLDGNELRDIEIASVLHDVGKIGVPDAILQKPGRLSEEEFAIVKRHSEFGWAILRTIPGFERVSLLVLHHHERYDGKGYPSGLRGRKIPLGARIVAVVDTFDAMLSTRPYREGLAIKEIIKRLEPEFEAQFDGEILQKFFDIVFKYVDEVSEIREPVR